LFKIKNALILPEQCKIDLVRELYKFLQDEHNQGIKNCATSFCPEKVPIEANYSLSEISYYRTSAEEER